MEVHCAGCAGCCIDWREVSPAALDHERRGLYEPLDDIYNLVPLSRDDVRAFLDAQLADALTPRLWRSHETNGVTIDDTEVAAVDGKPTFFIGLEKPPKPVAPFGLEAMWLPSCIFLDPTTLQCRIHGSKVYPDECAEYPGHNLSLDVETECERVERTFGGDRLLDRSVPTDLSAPLFGPYVLGQKVFVHPRPDRLTGIIERVTTGSLSREDRAEFVAIALAQNPGNTDINDEVYETSFNEVLATESWVSRAICEWQRLRDVDADPNPTLAATIEEAPGASPTPGWKRSTSR